MNSREEIRKEFESQTGNMAIIFPACHGETGYASWEYQLWLEQKILAAQQFRSPDMAEALSLLKEYEQWEADLIADNEMWWPSVPKDRISGKTYDKMIELQAKRNKLLASLCSPGSGWVKVEDGLPEIPPPYFENGLKLTPLGCRVIVYDSVSKEVYEANYYDGHFDDNNPDITHWRPLPTPPGVEDNQTKKQ